MARTYMSGTARIHPFGVNCATPRCQSRIEFDGSTAAEFYDAFNEAHHEGWLCLVENILDMTCPRCNAAPRSYQWHRLVRHKLANQPEWKRDIVLSSWAAMFGIQDKYLRETEIPVALRRLLDKDKTPDAAAVRQSLEHIERSFSRRSDEPNAAEAARLAAVALGRG